MFLKENREFTREKGENTGKHQCYRRRVGQASKGDWGIHRSEKTGKS